MDNFVRKIFLCLEKTIIKTAADLWQEFISGFIFFEIHEVVYFY
jgi:hypothetical protein